MTCGYLLERMKYKPKFVIVRCEDWEGLYKDGTLIDEGHEVSIHVILAQMGLELEEWRADDFLDAYERNRLPEKLSDVIKDP